MESLSVQLNHPAVVHLQPVHPADDEPLDDEPIQSVVIHVQSIMEDDLNFKWKTTKINQIFSGFL